MAFFILFILLAVLVVVGDLRMKIWDSKRRMINAEWLDDAEKFDLITRWGA